MGDDGEQVVGVMKRCDVCDDKTLHVDGVCREHEVVRRKKRVRSEPEPKQIGRRAFRTAIVAAVIGFVATAWFVGKALNIGGPSDTAWCEPTVAPFFRNRCFTSKAECRKRAFAGTCVQSASPWCADLVDRSQTCFLILKDCLDFREANRGMLAEPARGCVRSDGTYD